MNLQEIIDEVDGAWVPNTITTKQKVAWLNAINREVYRKVSFPSAIDKQYTVAGTALYPLPVNCKPDRIQRVIVMDSAGNQQTYTMRTMDDRLEDYSCAIVQDTLLWVYPTPTVSGVDGGAQDSIWIYYTPSPTEFSETNLTVSPQIPADYHRYYVMRLAEYAAKASDDVLKANNFKADADEILANVIRDFDSDGVTSFQTKVVW